MSSATHQQDVLVVTEGADRLRWDGGGGRWELAGVWPDPAERARLEQHLDAGRPVLVVLDGTEAVVPAWRDEVRQLPAGLSVRADSDDSELVDVVVPALDWLRAEERTRGLRFAEQAAEVERRTPRHLLPPVLVDSGETEGSPVRFARPTRGLRTLAPDVVESVLDAVAPQRQDLAPAA